MDFRHFPKIMKNRLSRSTQNRSTAPTECSKSDFWIVQVRTKCQKKLDEIFFVIVKQYFSEKYVFEQFRKNRGKSRIWLGIRWFLTTSLVIMFKSANPVASFLYFFAYIKNHYFSKSIDTHLFHNICCTQK